METRTLKRLPLDRKLLDRLLEVGQGVFGLAVLFMVGRFIYLNWRDVSSVDFQLNIAYFFVACIFLALFYLLYTATWQRLLKWISSEAQDIRRITLHRVFFSSLLTRYLPAGKVVNVGSRIELYHRAGGRRLIAAQSLILDQVYLMGGALVIGWCALAFLPGYELPGELSAFRWIFLTAGVLLVLLLVFAADKLLVWFLRITGLSTRYGIGFTFAINQRLEIFVRYLAINLLQGSAAFFFLLSVYRDLYNVGGFALAYIAAYPIGRLVGQIAVVVPGGLGVREGVYALLISAYTPVQAAMLGAGIVRLASVLMELVINTVVIALEKQSEQPALRESVLSMDQDSGGKER